MIKKFNDESMEKIIETMKDDSISRNNAVFNFIKMISKLDDNDVIAINGNWGSGKTFFVKQIELLINFINNINEEGNYANEALATNNLSCIKDLSAEDKKQLNEFINAKRKDLRTYFEGNQTNCLYFNAWEYDNNQSPILSIIYKIINDFPYLSLEISKDKEKMLAIFDTISTSLTNGTIKISDYTDQNDLLKQIKTSEEVKESINQLFKKLLEENSNKMVIIIDELDRCRPTYAIRLLEEIKHYINSKNIIIVLATNIYQLSSTIKNNYGYDFEVDEFLDKIIDLTLSLQPIDKYKYVNSLGMESFEGSSTWFTDVIMAYINYKKLEMRSINRFIRLMSLYEKHITTKRRARKLHLMEYIFLPYCLGEQIFNSSKYNQFIRGNGFKEFYKYISSSERLQEIIEECIYCSTRKDQRNIEEDMQKLYDMIYNQKENATSVKVGNEEFYSYDIKYLFDLCTMLNDFNIGD